LSLSDVKKRFGPTIALDGVSLQLRKGEVHALIGENGAGKSTLMNVLAGSLSPDAGRMEIAGQPYAPANPLEARLNRIALIHQELSLATHLSVAENIMMGIEPSRFGWLDRKTLHARALEVIARYYEMPFLIRRRRHDEPSAERVRLTERFADVQAELASCEALMRADPEPDVRRAYAALVRTIRTHAGTQASSAWNTPPITSDAEMGMGDVMEALEPIEVARATCENAMARSTMPRHRRGRS